MKKLLLSSVALFGLSTAALAADLPRRQYVAPAPIIAVPVFTWTGFYVGVNAGAAFRDNNRDNTCFDSFGFGFGDCFGGSALAVRTNAGLAPVVPVTGFNALGLGLGLNNRQNNDVVFAGGGQIGYNYQFTPGAGWVIGVEADIQGLANNNRNDDFLALGGLGGFNGIFTAAPVAPIAPGSGIANPTGVGNGALGNVALFSRGPLGRSLDISRLDWFATVRGRLGYAWDRFLIYATGGVAFTDRGNNGDDFGAFGGGFGIPSGASLVGTGFYTSPAAAFSGNLVAPTNVFLTNSNNNNNVGWTVGGGVEWAFAYNWTAKIEGLYVSFDRNRNNNTGFIGGEVVGVSNTGAQVTAGQLGFNNRRDRDDFGVVRVGVNYKFGTY